MTTDTLGRSAPRVPTDSLQPGTTIDDRYEVLDVLGQGGCATVYRVYDQRLKLQLALKLLHPGRTVPGESVRLRREVRFAREVRSEHLVRIFDVSNDEETPYITMELVEGETLAARLRREGPLSLDETLRIGSEVLRALEALHAHGIVHRDVKPGNVLLSTDGHVRLADLGLARTVLGDESAATNPETMVGTWQYIAPEQALGFQAGPETDLYSFGVMLFEMLTGRLPFECDSSVGYLTAHLTRSPQRLRRLRPDLPRWIDTVVSRLLEKQARDRYRSASDVREDLTSRDATVRPRTGRRLRTLVSLLLLLTTVAGAYLWWSMRFEKLEVTSGRIEAVDHRGQTLWARNDLNPSLTTVFQSNGQIGIATFENRSRDAAPEERLRLSILDPQTGHLRERIDLPSGASFFPGMPDQFAVTDLQATDLDHDGYHEIQATLTHDYWPSYAVMWNPITDEREVTFLASGHHRLAGTADVHGDGTDELIFIGINNKMGWNWALAAVSAGSDGKVVTPGHKSSTPDTTIQWVDDGLVWYALLPRDARWVPLPKIDEKQKLIRVHRSQKAPLEISFSGFETSMDSDLPPSERNERRRDAYGRIREGNRRLLSDQPGEAVESLDLAIQLAGTAGDPVLQRWAETLEAKALIETGDFMRAESIVSKIVAESPGDGSDTHWEAATTYHLRGELRRAFEHYRSGLARRETVQGRFSREFAINGVLALVELADYDQARDFIEVFERSEQYSQAEDEADHLRAFVRWMEGTDSSLPDPIKGFTLYEFRYWNLEQRRDVVDPERLLEQADALLDTTGDLAPMILSLQAELLHDLGRRDEARDVAERALDAMQSEIRHNIFVRAHRELIESRYEKITSGSG